MAGITRRYHQRLKVRILFTFFNILFPNQKWGAKADFKYYKNENISGSR